jgi:hypothetical protein
MHYQDHGWLPIGQDRSVRSLDNASFMSPVEWRQNRIDQASGLVRFDGEAQRTGQSPGGFGGAQPGGTPGAGSSSQGFTPKGAQSGNGGGGLGSSSTPGDRRRRAGRGGEGRESDYSSDSIGGHQDRKRSKQFKGGRGFAGRAVGGAGSGGGGPGPVAPLPGAGAGVVGGQVGDGAGAVSSGSGWGAGVGQWGQGDGVMSRGAGQASQGLWDQLPEEWKNKIQGGGAGAGGFSRLG